MHTAVPPDALILLILTTANMCANAHVSSCASQVLVLSVRYVLVCDRIEVLFCKSEVYNVDDMFTASRSPSN